MTALGAFAAGLASWRAILASGADLTARMALFANACKDVARYTTRGLEQAAAADELQSMAEANGLVAQFGADAVQNVMAQAFDAIEQVPDVIDEPSKANGHDRQRLSILSKAQFLAQVRKPNFLVDGLLQYHFIYALTGQTGHAKTAVALLIAQLVACSDRNAVLGLRRVRKGRVIYLVGENADDVGYRIIGGDAQRSDQPELDNISFIPGIFDIAQMLDELRANCLCNGEVALIIVDTSAAYFLGNEELSNTQMGAYARTLRLLTSLPGGPCVLVLCHPVKHVTEPSQLLPRGGGAYLAEMDGNLTLWRLADDMVELHHTKIRGPSFQAITFKLESVTSTKLTDAEDRPFSTVRAVAISQSEEEQRLTQDEEDEDRVLAAILAKPADDGGSFATWAQNIGWVTAHDEPYKKKVERIVVKFAAAKPKLTVKMRNKWCLTEEGKDAARKAALRFDLARQKTAQGALI